MNAPATLTSTWHTAGFQGPRTINADAVASRVDVSGGLVVALADGVGDRPSAARAARLAAAAAAAVPAAAGPAAALLAAHEAVEADSEAGDCVLIVAQPFGSGYRLAWVGDVRAYAWTGRDLFPLTTDHTLAQYLRDRGTTPTPAMEHQVLTSVRTAGAWEFGLASLAVPARLLLTTDGVHKTLTHKAMTDIMRTATTTDPATALVTAARNAGTRDNTTAVVVDNTHHLPTKPLPAYPTAA